MSDQVDPKVREEFVDAALEAWDAGWRAAMRARGVERGDAYTRGYLTQLVYQAGVTWPFGDTLAEAHAKQAANAILRNCEVRILDPDEHGRP